MIFPIGPVFGHFEGASLGLFARLSQGILFSAQASAPQRIEDGRLVLEEIVVTAQKPSLSILDVPVALTSIA